MEQIADPLNLQKAYHRVSQNDGGAGVDGMRVKDLKVWLGNNLNDLRQQLLESHYQPQSVRGVQILKPQGGYRQLGVPTVKDRMVQQAIQQVLSIR